MNEHNRKLKQELWESEISAWENLSERDQILLIAYSRELKKNCGSDASIELHGLISSKNLDVTWIPAE